MKAINQYFTLSNGVKLPKIGLGTWQVKDGDEAYHSVLMALKKRVSPHRYSRRLSK